MKIKLCRGARIALFRKTSNGYEIFLRKCLVKPGTVRWLSPGGLYRRKDFSFFICAYKRFFEETGRIVPSGEILGVKMFIYPFYHWKSYIYFTSDPMNYRRVSIFSEAKWIPLNEVYKYRLGFGVNQEIRKFRHLARKNKESIQRIYLQSVEKYLPR